MLSGVENEKSFITSKPDVTKFDITFIRQVFFLWDIGKQNSPRCDAEKRDDRSGAFLFADIFFIEKWNKNEKSPLMSLSMKVDSSK